MSLTTTCPLCESPASPFKDGLYQQCSHCLGIFLTPARQPDAATERARYEEHHNDVNDARYQQFVSPLTDAALRDFGPEHTGLDFGAGTGPVACKILQDAGYDIQAYDPFFHPHPELLLRVYDYIICCEVIEHFFYPAQAFTQLKGLLKPGGAIYCKTHLYDESIPFLNWYYRKDPTHAFIYTVETLHWIKARFGFRELVIEGSRLATFLR